MASFSERYKYEKTRDSVQKESMDDALRNGLWNALVIKIYRELDYDLALFSEYWHSYFKETLDTAPNVGSLEMVNIVRRYFFDCEWYKVYNFIEFTAQNAPAHLVNDFKKFANNVLTREMSAYRFIGDEITEITSEEEIKSIEEAIVGASKLTKSGVKIHLESSLKLLSDRKSLDFRNSVKEAISAVEAICQLITKDKKTTLGKALKIIDEQQQIHPSLKLSITHLYGYTSDAGGIRHAMLEENDITFDDAKFMLVSCTAFINYLFGKVNATGISIDDA